MTNLTLPELNQAIQENLLLPEEIDRIAAELGITDEERKYTAFYRLAA